MSVSLRPPASDHRDRSSPHPSAQALLSLRDLTMSYGPTRALVRCAFEVAPGEIRAVLGENGSGKSTLVKILSGVLPADTGQVLLNGRPVRFRSPREAQAAGIVTVFQETLVVPDLSVLDNIFLGTDRLFGWCLSRAEQHRRAAALLERLGAGGTPLEAPVEALALERRQIVAIARALCRPWRVLILDEATSALDIDSREALFAELRRRPAGRAVIFISHRMDEIATLADAVTLLQAGETTATLEIGHAPAAVLVAMIARSRGRGTEEPPPTPAGSFPVPAQGLPRLRARRVVLRRGTLPIDLDIAAGRIVGFGGLDGHGQAEMLGVLAGLRIPLSGQVDVAEGASWHPVSSAAEAVRRGIVSVPRERKSEGLFPTLSVLDNYSAPTLRRWSRLCFIDRAGLSRQARSDLDALNTRFSSLSTPITRLSGGNQQKVLLARWLAASPKVLVLNDPLRGVDAATKADIHALFRGLAADGIAVVLLSSEIEELLALCHEIVVFREGHVSQRLGAAALSRQAVVAAMFGQAPSGARAATPAGSSS